MTGAAQMASGCLPSGPARARPIALAAARWLVAAGICVGGPTLALWAGSQTQPSGSPSMGSVVLVVAVLATVSYALVGVLRLLTRTQDELGDIATADGTRVPWLHAKPRAGWRAHAGRARVDGIPASPRAERVGAGRQPAREPLVLIDGSAGTARPWESVIPHLEFGFEVLAGVLPRDGSIDGTQRAMDRGGWQTAHVVARPRDARAAVELARRGRARSLLILDDDTATEDSVAVATEIAEFAAFRSPE